MVEVTVLGQCLVLVSVVLVSLISLVIVGLNITEIVCSDMQDAAGNIFVDRNGI